MHQEVNKYNLHERQLKFARRACSFKDDLQCQSPPHRRENQNPKRRQTKPAIGKAVNLSVDYRVTVRFIATEASCVVPVLHLQVVLQQ